ncbi:MULTISPECIES: TetR family transcriptional regulator C-terminal domain-containing protein [unclassified Rhizobium]|uniref:TetR/AcrR family transcriptional regulator n=1 Tax=unclassified Rhizobium TaxID=2613769 RepID=UPI00380BDA64
MPKPSNKNDIIAAGLRVMFRKGYNGAGIRDVVAEAGVPQGSFTNHFRSKEAFAAEVLDQYFAHTRELVGQAFNDRSLGPRERLLRYLDIITERLADDDYLRGCLIGDFSIEVSQTSELLRERLAAIYQEWRKPFERCITEAQQAGEIGTRFSASDLADFLLVSWEGAILRMKVDRSAEALDRFKRIAFATVFAAEPPF